MPDPTPPGSGDPRKKSGDASLDALISEKVTELERVVQFGFTQSELDRDKLDSQRYLDQALLEKDKSPSAPLAETPNRQAAPEQEK